MSILPKSATPPKRRLSEFSIFMFGAVKIGKTELASGFEDALFLATEAGQGGISCYRVSVDSWPILLEACGELAKGQHPFKTVVIDTIDGAWSLCQRHICEQQRIQHEADLPYGKGYSLVLGEFCRVITKLSHLGLGLVFISHADKEEIQGRTSTYQRAVPSLKDRARSFLLALCDMVLFCDSETSVGPDNRPLTRRVLRTKPDPRWEAGDRTGLLPETIDLSYVSFAAAFDAAMHSRADEAQKEKESTQ